MTAIILNNDALLAVPPPALVAYAASLGWKLPGTPYGDVAHVYQGKKRQEILIPVSQGDPSYGFIVRKLLRVFAEVAGMDEAQVYRDLLVANRDVIRFRAPSEDDGTVSIEDGLSLVGSARDMFSAAAASIGQAKAIYRPKSNKSVSNLINGTRLGQTEHGSYVVTVLTPLLASELDMYGLDPAPEPFARQATLRFATALSTTRDAARSPELQAFLDGIKHGVSANLCESLADAITPFKGLDVSITWARTRPRKVARTNVSFTDSDAPYLRDIARIFRESEPESDVTIIGSVVMLEGQGGGEPGTVVIRGLKDDKPISVSVSLESDDYSAMIKAHEDQAWVQAHGELQRSGSRWHLKQATVSPIQLDD